MSKYLLSQYLMHKHANDNNNANNNANNNNNNSENNKKKNYNKKEVFSDELFFMLLL